MAETMKVEVNPQLLSWVRHSYGMSTEEVAEKSDIKPATLEAIETGENEPSISQLRRLAKVYKRPYLYFFRDTIPADLPSIQDFRKLPKEEVEASHIPQLNVEVQEARRRRQVILDLFDEMDIPAEPFNLHGSLQDEPEVLGARIRQFLQVNILEQFSWRKKSDAFRNWKDAVEAKNILVFQVPDLDIEVFRGLSLTEQILPVIVINRADSPAGKTFSLIHELVHLAINISGLCNGHEDDRSFIDVEAFCNRVAASMLVPRDVLLSFDEIQQHSVDAEWDDDTIRKIAKTFSVSKEVIVRRLVTVGKAPQSFYEAKRKEYLKGYRDFRIKQKERDGFLPPAQKAVSNNGMLYITTVFDAYNQRVITQSDVSRFLGVRLKHLARIEERTSRFLKKLEEASVPS